MTELSLHAPHSEDVTQQQSQDYAGLHQHLTGLDQETQKVLKNLELLCSKSVTGPESERLRQREAEVLREVRRQNNDRRILKEGQQIICDLRSEVMQLRPSLVPPNLKRNLEAKIQSQKYEIQNLQQVFTDSTGFI